VIGCDRGRPARKRAAGSQAAFQIQFALRAYCGRDARGPSQSLDRLSETYNCRLSSDKMSHPFCNT